MSQETNLFLKQRLIIMWTFHILVWQEHGEHSISIKMLCIRHALTFSLLVIILIIFRMGTKRSSTCVGYVTKGTVDQSDQCILDEEELSKGKCVTCQAYHTSDCTIENFEWLVVRLIIWAKLYQPYLYFLNGVFLLYLTTVYKNYRIIWFANIVYYKAAT